MRRAGGEVARLVSSLKYTHKKAIQSMCAHTFINRGVEVEESSFSEFSLLVETKTIFYPHDPSLTIDTATLQWRRLQRKEE